MDEKARQIFEKLEGADSIVIFGHKNPDGDCVGSILGMKHALLDNFPSKKVYAVGTHPEYLGTSIEASDEVSDDVIKNSLALLVDLSDLPRVEDQRISLAKEIVCFDHHVADKEAEFLVYRDEKAPSCTYILAKLLLERYGSISKIAAKYLYLGLTTDTGRYQFDSEPSTLRMGATLVECGVDYKSLYNELYRQNSADLIYRAYVYQHFKFSGRVTYCVMRKDEYQALGMNASQAGGRVNLLSLIDDHPIWAFFTEQDDSTFRGELRSNGHYDVQKVAKKFRGGGHVPAAGCTLKSIDEITALLKELNGVEAI